MPGCIRRCWELPPNLINLFAPRPPLTYVQPVGKSPNVIKKKKIDGVAALLQRLKDDTAREGTGSKELSKNMEEGEARESAFTHTEETIRQINREEQKNAREAKFKSAIQTYKPTEDPRAVGDPYKTLFISRLLSIVTSLNLYLTNGFFLQNKQATENDISREFERYGKIERIRVVRDEKGRSKGYAFVVYERERDMKVAYKEAYGLYILGKKIIVDVERGRTVLGWKPRRLGGGLGGRPKLKPLILRRYSGGGCGGKAGWFKGGKCGGDQRRCGERGSEFFERPSGGRDGGRDGYYGRMNDGPSRGGDFGSWNDGYGNRSGPSGGAYRGRARNIDYEGGFSNGANGHGASSITGKVDGSRGSSRYGRGGYDQSFGGYKRKGGGYDDYRGSKRRRY